jgi:hypothetical protein
MGWNVYFPHILEISREFGIIGFKSEWPCSNQGCAYRRVPHYVRCIYGVYYTAYVIRRSRKLTYTYRYVVYVFIYVRRIYLYTYGIRHIIRTPYDVYDVRILRRIRINTSTSYYLTYFSTHLCKITALAARFCKGTSKIRIHKISKIDIHNTL